MGLFLVDSKRMVEHLETYLNTQAFPAVAIHDDRTKVEHEAAIEAFRSGKAQVLVTLHLEALRGLVKDVKDVNHVIVYDPPKDIKSYIDRISRCAAKGTAVTFFNEKNIPLAVDLVQVLEEAELKIEPWLYEYAFPPREKSKKEKERERREKVREKRERHKIEREKARGGRFRDQPNSSGKVGLVSKRTSRNKDFM